MRSWRWPRARELLRRAGEDALSDARVLAERPTLQRLLERRAIAAWSHSCSRFSETTGADVAALMRGDTALAQSGRAVDWPEIATALQEQGERFVIAPRRRSADLGGRGGAARQRRTRGDAAAHSASHCWRDSAQQVGAQLQVVEFRHLPRPAGRRSHAPAHPRARQSGRRGRRRARARPYLRRQPGARRADRRGRRPARCARQRRRIRRRHPQLRSGTGQPPR